SRKNRLAGVLARALRDHGDERRQILIHAAKTVANPRAHARVAGLLVAGVKERDGRVVVDRLGVHRFHDADVVGDRLHMRQEIADPGAVLTAFAAGPHGATTGKLAWPEVMPVIRCVPFTDGGSSLPWLAASVGLLSNKSTCEKPSLWK